MGVRSKKPPVANRARLGMVSTFPPTACGIATFARALSDGLGTHGVEVVRVDAGCGSAADPSTVPALGSGTDVEIDVATAALRDCDAVIVQHEYGIYPGQDGSGVLDLVDCIEAPVVVVAHTVLAQPTDRQRSILVELCSAAAVVVVMTQVARDRLVTGYGVERSAVVVIPHGAAVAAAEGRSAATSGSGRRILTWGLLGPGKGIEWAIEAMAQLGTTGPLPHYLIAGATHPNVKARHGEQYRHFLERRATELGVGDRVMFDDSYRTVDELGELIATADLVVLPYDSPDQVTSGVLVDAVAAGRPVVSTAFPHAVELLAGGVGIVVPQRDPDALCRAMGEVLFSPERAASMAASASRIAPSLSWPAVAGQYLGLSERLSGDRPDRVAS